MNNVSLIGRMTKDIQVNGQGDKAVGKFTLAVNRDFKNKEGKYDADFINCTCFGKRAETLAQYTTKGTRLGVVGKIQTGKYTNKEGQTVYTTEVILNGFDFLESKDAGTNTNTSNDDMDWEEVDEGDVPF